jgi:hypothetical protein
MTLLRMPTLLLLVLVTPIAALAADPPAQADPPSGTEAAAAPQPKEVDLPYGAGYEARHRRGQGGEQTAQEQAGAREETQARAETKSAARERDRIESRASATDARPARDTTDRSQATRESRREARGHWGQHGPVRR